MQKVKVFFACPGLGRIRRGFESFTRECFDVLLRAPELELMLYSGGGDVSANERPLRALDRNGGAAKTAAALLGRTPYYVEQATFALSLIPHLRREKPDVVYFSDGTLGNALWRWRKMSGASFKLVLSNGAPFEETFERWEHVQQLTAATYDRAIARGVPREKQTLLPYGIHIRPELKPFSAAEQTGLRRALNLPEDRPVLIAPGAVNSYHKRMDYIVREVAALGAEKPYLAFIGEREEETPEIEKLASELLGAANFTIRTVPPDEMQSYYRAADAMTLASLNEGFGRVIVEAASFGLSCLVHDYDVTRFILEENGNYGDLTQGGALGALIRQALPSAADDSRRQTLHESMLRRFSWDALRERYVAMLTGVR